MSMKRRIVLGCLALGSAACAYKQPGTGAPLTAVETIYPDEPAAPTAPPVASAGRTFSLRLDRAIGGSSEPGEPLTGRLVTVITAPDGTLVATQDALVTARIVRIEPGASPRIDVAFRSIETVDGRMVPLHASVLPTQTSSAIDAQPAARSDVGYDASLAPKGIVAIGGGPPPGAPGAYTGTGIPAGTRLDLALTAPLSP
jgi:hypothetical protein